jgi:ppGpp synthetase/RelA/SpoT-type nucleotidyltranferase
MDSRIKAWYTVWEHCIKLGLKVNSKRYSELNGIDMICKFISDLKTQGSTVKKNRPASNNRISAHNP